jgi:hypothetical protein
MLVNCNAVFLDIMILYDNVNMDILDYTGCGKLTSFFEYEMPYEKGS